jgi:hypothetical protein
MESVATATSVLALCVSIFNLYWTSLRKKRVLTLVSTNIWTDYSADFVLANGSNCDLFLAKVICSFRGADKSAALIPKQQYIFQDSSRGFVAAGKATSFKLQILEKLNDQELADGDEDKHTSMKLHMFDLKLDVYWIEPSGKEFQAECVFGRYGLDDTGGVRVVQEVHRNFSLYTQKVEIPIGGRPSML